MQSWGHDSQFDSRETLDFPTKSGVFGLLCCARGAGGAQHKWLQHWGSHALRAYAYGRDHRRTMTGRTAASQPDHSQFSHSAIPPVKLSTLKDYQVIGAGYDKSDGWENLMIPKTSAGKRPAEVPGNRITVRYYIQDMAYAVTLSGQDDELSELHDAVCNPVWDLYLGRKSCAPVDLIARGVYSSLEDAEAAANDIARAKQRQEYFRVIEGADITGTILTLNDVPIQFGKHKRYGDRQVTILQP